MVSFSPCPALISSTEVSRVSESAGHEDGACQKRVGILNACNIGEADADAILDDGDNAGNQPVDEQQDAPPSSEGKGTRPGQQW